MAEPHTDKSISEQPQAGVAPGAVLPEKKMAGEEQTDKGVSEQPQDGGKATTRKTAKIMKGIYENVRGKARPPEQVEVYSRLMAHLEHMEASKPHHWCVYLLRTINVFLFLSLVVGLVCSLTVESANQKRLLKLRIWQYLTMAIMVTAVFSVVPTVTYLICRSLRCRFWTRKHWVYYLVKMKRSVDVTLWSFLVLAGWYMWFRPRLNHVHGDVSRIACRQVTRLIIALCIGCVLWSLKNALYYKLEADLHYGQLFDRIRLTIMYLNGNWILNDRRLKAPEAKLLAYKKQDGGNISDPQKNEGGGNIWLDVEAMERESAPIWIMMMLSKYYLKAMKEMKAIKPLDVEQLINDDELLMENAKEMFLKVKGIQVVHPFAQILKEDIAKYNLPDAEVDYFFKLKEYEKLDPEIDNQGITNPTTQSQSEPNKEDENKYRRIGVDEFLGWAVRGQKNCWGLETTLKSSKIAFVKLNRMLSAFLLVLIVIIWLLLSKIVNTGQLALLFAPFLAASFMFENSSKNMFQGIIFAFAMRPFDVGDRVIIEDIQMRVKEVNILTSVFYKYDTGAEVIFPNSKLATIKIANLDITPDQSDQLDFVIRSTNIAPQESTEINDTPTPLECIKDLELKIQLLLDENLSYASCTKVVKNPQDPEKPRELKMTVHFKYLVSYLTTDKKAEHRSKILSMIMNLRREMEMDSHMKEYPLHYKPFVIEVTADNFKLSSIQGFKHHILGRFREDCKVVLTNLKDEQREKKIEMALYVSVSGYVAELQLVSMLEAKLKNGTFLPQNILREYGYSSLKVSWGEQMIYQGKWQIHNQAIRDGVGQSGDSRSPAGAATAAFRISLPSTSSNNKLV